MPRRKKIPLQTKTDVLIEAGYRCGNPACNIVLTPDILEDHHIIGVAAGGGNEPVNLLALCPNCHSLFTHGKISLAAIRHWKSMLVALNNAYSRDCMDLLVFLYHGWGEMCFTSDVLPRYAGLIVSGLVEPVLHPDTPPSVINANLRILYTNGVDYKSSLQRVKEWLRKEAEHDESLEALEVLDPIVEYIATSPPPTEAATWYRTMLYGLRLTERGKMLVKAWVDGDAAAYTRMLATSDGVPEGGQG